MVFSKGYPRDYRENKKLEFAKFNLSRRGYDDCKYDEQEKALYIRRPNGAIVKYWPFTEYFNGKGIKAGRGFFTLLDELKSCDGNQR